MIPIPNRYITPIGHITKVEITKKQSQKLWEYDSMGNMTVWEYDSKGNMSVWEK